MKSRIFPIRESETLTEQVNHEKPDIVSSIGILGTGISESDDESHMETE